MGVIKLATFSGILPRVPRSLLPDNAAQEAVNCDFAYGELRALKAPLALKSLSGAVSSLYTEDGINFYSWPSDVNAEKSPVIGDTFRRVYFTTGFDFRVADGTMMRSTGGQPSTSYRVGVPQATVAPLLAVAEGGAVSGDFTVDAYFWYESSGVKYQEQFVTLETIEDKKKYRFTPPAKTGGSSSSGGGTAESITIASLGYMGDSGYTADQQFLPFKARAVARDAIVVTDPLSSGLSNGTTLTGSAVQAQDGQVHDVATLFSMTRYTVVDEGGGSSGSSSTGATPSSAFPALLLHGNSTVDGSELWHAFTSNSSFVDPNAPVKATLSADPDNAGKWIVTLDLGDGAGGAASVDDETRAYTYTFVNTFNEEGAPAPAAVFTTKVLNNVKVSVTLPASGEYAPIKTIRIYRSVTGTDSDNYFLVKEFPCLSQPPGVYDVVDDVRAGGLGEILRSVYWLPPTTTLKGLTNIGNGMLMAWKGNELWFCEAYRPHAWSPMNVLTFPHNLVAGVPHGAGALVVTTAGPHLVSGVSPDSMTQTALPVQQAAVAKRAIATVRGAAVYGSHDGLVVVQAGVPSLEFSERFFTRETWRARYGAHLPYLMLAAYDGGLIGFFSNGGAAPFVIRLDEAAGAMSDVGLGAAVTACFNLPTTDGLYIAQGSQLSQWAAGSAMVVDWTSKEAVLARPTNLGAGYIVVEPGSNIFITFVADGAVRHQQQFTETAYFRLPSGYKAQRVTLLISGTGTLRELYLAETMRDLAAT